MRTIRDLAAGCVRRASASADGRQNHGGSAEDTGPEVGNMYAVYHARTIAEGLAMAGGPDHDRPLSLIRSACAGSQRYGAALWSGDIAPTFASLASQVRAGLNVAMSAIPYWNTDIGVFECGDPDDPAYREVTIRWFQYGTFSPIMRLHLLLRERLRPYLTTLAKAAHETAHHSCAHCSSTSRPTRRRCRSTTSSC